jgi:hypothetical protein
MSATRKVWVIAIVTTVAGAIGVAAAQTPQTEPAVDTTDALGPQQVNLSPEQMKTEAATYLPQMEQGQGTVRRQLEEARAARDVVKVLCLNDKLTQLDVALRSGRERYSAFMIATERGDSERSRHEFTVLQVLRDRAQELVAEAAQCIGEETGFVGDSRVTVDVDPDIPADEPNVPPPDIFSPPSDVLVSTPPAPASPTQ